MIRSINININGSNTPFATWEKNNIESNGAFGIIMIITAIIISPKYNPWNIGASRKFLLTPASKPSISHTKYAVANGKMLAANNDAFKNPNANNMLAYCPARGTSAFEISATLFTGIP